MTSKLNSRNLINWINTWAVAVVPYSAGIVNWTKDEVDTLDSKTRKALTTHGALHQTADITRVIIHEKKEWRKRTAPLRYERCKEW